MLQKILSLSLFLIYVFLLLPASAGTDEGLDYGLSVPARTYSPGLAVIPYAGYGKLLWGETDSPFYGFVRPNLAPFASPTLVGARAGVELFPVSFVGFSAGQSYLHRFVDSEGQNCETVECQGSLAYSDLGLRLLVGHQGFFISTEYQLTFYNVEDSQAQPVLEPSLSLLLGAGKDELTQLKVALGRQLNEQLVIGVLYQEAELQKAGGEQQAQYLFAQTSLKDYGYEGATLTLGVGSFESELQPRSFSIIGNLNLIGRAALGLGR